MASTHLALLRGINVSGKNQIRMPVLAEIFTSLGCKNVTTYIQSGNVLFTATKPLAARLETLASRAIQDQLGLTVPVLIRSAADLVEAVAANPFPEAVEFPKKLHLLFLQEEPTAAALATLDPDRSAPDRYLVRGRHLYMYLAGSAADTKLTNAYFDSRLKTISTGRNWKTVQTLIHLM